MLGYTALRSLNHNFFEEKMNKNSVKEIWILYPDPWPKKKHHKRRLVNNFFLNKIYPYLKKNCKVFVGAFFSF